MTPSGIIFFGIIWLFGSIAAYFVLAAFFGTARQSDRELDEALWRAAENDQRLADLLRERD